MMNTTNTQPTTAADIEKLLLAAYQQATIADNISTQYDEATCIKYMNKIPVWQFYSMSKDEYLLKSRKEKFSMISDYYNQMKKDEKIIFFFFFFFFCCCLDLSFFEISNRSFSK